MYCFCIQSISTIQFTLYISHHLKKTIVLISTIFLMKMLRKAVHWICVTFYSTSCYKEKFSITFYLKLETCY